MKIQDLKNILLLDIETIGIAETYDQLDERFKKEWDRKSRFLMNSDTMTPKELFEERAGIYSEFGKIVVIGLGLFNLSAEKELSLRVKALAGVDERKLLEDFKQLIESKFRSDQLSLCAHNGKEFDFPYIIRRMLVNGVSLPDALNYAGKKPWEIRHIDTMDLWKFGDRKSFTSLELLATLFGIESSKSGLDGSKVNETFYKEKNLEKIIEYCKEDVVVTGQVFLKLNGFPSINKENIHLL